MKSGIYLVTLNNEDLISVNAHDKRIADKCIKVNKTNCKFGKAQNLEIREKNYFKTFGEENVNFRVIAKLGLEDIAIAEKAFKAALDPYRIRGSTGKPNEWLKSIHPDDVIEIVIHTLKRLENEGKIAIRDWGVDP